MATKVSKEEINYFKEYYLDAIEMIKENIDNLSNDALYQETIYELLHLFKTLYGQAALLNIDALKRATDVVMQTLHILKFRKPPIDASVVDWLSMFLDYMAYWNEDFKKNNFNVVSLDSYTLNMIKISALSTDKSKQLLKQKTLLVITSNEKLGMKINHFLNTHLKKSFLANTQKKLMDEVQRFNPDFVLIDSDTFTQEHFVCIQELHKRKVPIPVITFGNNLPQEYTNHITKLCIDGHLDKPLKSKLLLQKITSLAELYYGKRKLDLIDKGVYDLIKMIKPLDRNVREIQKLSTDKSASLEQISDIISLDSILSAKILTAVNLRKNMRTQKKVDSIHQAVSLLGKENTVSIVLQGAIEGSYKNIDLSPYKLNKTKFYEISMMRMQLISKWFSHVSSDYLPVLSTAALLGNIGQIIISTLVQQQDIQLGFEEFIEKGKLPSIAEVEFFNITCEEISADLLSIWELDPSLINALRYSHDLMNAPDEYKQLAIACYVTFHTINSLQPSINQEQVPEMAQFLQEMNFDKQPYLDAVASLT